MEPLSRDEVRLHIEADPQTLYDLVSDVTRTPEWSPEVIACESIDGATGPAVGARFKARNKLRWFSWSNRPKVVAADPGREFAVSRTERGGGTMVWRYRFEPAGSGTTVIQSYEVVESVPMGLLWTLRLVFGIRDRRADLHENMQTSLRRLANIAEQEAGRYASQERAMGSSCPLNSAGYERALSGASVLPGSDNIGGSSRGMAPLRYAALKGSATLRSVNT